MKKVDLIVSGAIAAKRSICVGNTMVSVTGSDVKVYLHGNLIYKEIDGKKSFSLAGWNTKTTRARLTACGVDVRQKKL